MRRTVTCLIVALCAVLASNAAIGQTKKTIRLTNGEWQPYLSKDAPHMGFASHVVTEAFALVGVTVEYGFYPWGRAFKLAQAGTWDGTAVWLDSEERREDFYYSDPVVPSKVAFFHLKDSGFDWNSFEDLKDVPVGGTLKYAYGDEFDAAEKAGIIKTDRARDDVLGLKKLLKGRITVFPGEIMVTYEQIRSSLSEDEVAMLTHHPKLIHEQPQFLLLSKKVAGNEALRDLFNDGLKKLKSNGKYDQIIADALAGKYATPK